MSEHHENCCPSIKLTPQEYESLWALALTNSQHLLETKIESICANRNITLDPAIAAQALISRARNHLAPPCEAEIQALQRDVEQWRLKDSNKQACETIDKLIRRFRQQQNQLDTLDQAFSHAEEKFLAQKISGSKFFQKTTKEALVKLGVVTYADLLTLKKSKIQGVKLHLPVLCEKLSYNLAILYTQHRGDLHKPYTQNLQKRALDKILAFRKKNLG